MAERELEAFEKGAKIRGYRCYSIGGYTHTDRWGGDRRRGGVAILVKLSCKQRPRAAKANDTAAVIFAEVQGWKLGTAYAPPHEYDLRKLADAMRETCEEERLTSTGRWCVAGDFNEDAKKAETSPSFTVLRGAGGEINRVGEPTRWQGQREVDLVITNRRGEKPEVLDVWISDHKVPTWRFPTKEPIEPSGSLKQAPKWKNQQE
jgi:hypothetical protein